MARPTVVVASVIGMLSVGLASVFTLPEGAESARNAQKRLDSVPLDLPPWIGTDLPPTEKSTKYMKVAEAAAYINRHYTHTETRKVVVVSILYGNQGAMCAHDPDTCYAGSGYSSSGTATRLELPETSSLWLGRYEKGDPAPEGLEVSWGFTADGIWQAPDSPRMAFAGRSMLYKLYAQLPVARGASRKDSEPLKEFLTVFLPKLRVALTSE